jgi:beta-lactamase class A
MRLFGRSKSQEDDSRTKKIDTKKTESKRGRKKKKEKSIWGKGERYLVLLVLLGTALMSGFLALSARSWKLPGMPVISKLGFKQTFTFSGDKVSSEEFSGIEMRLEERVAGLSGVYGIYVVRLADGVSYGLMENEVFQAASLIKLPVMAAVYMEADRGTINLNSKLTLTEEDKVGGSGSLSGKSVGTEYTYRELVNYMGQQSDNTAFRMVRRALGDEKVNSAIGDLGMASTSLEDNETTPVDIGRFFVELYRGDITTNRRAKEIVDALTDTIYEAWIPAGIPDFKVAHKYGREVHVVNDAGIVFSERPYVLVIMTKGVVEREADQVIPELAKIVSDFESP